MKELHQVQELVIQLKILNYFMMKLINNNKYSLG